jgi:hypothetical protein
MKKTIETHIKNVIKEQKIQIQKEQDFIDKKEYIKVLNSVIGKSINNYTSEQWTDEIQMMFDLIYDNALELIVKSLSFDGEIILNYKGNLISFVEFCGQDCFNSIMPVEKYGDIEYPEYLVDFEDLEKYILTGEQPKRNYVIKTIFLALDALELFYNHYDTQIDIDEIRAYIYENLN